MGKKHVTVILAVAMMEIAVSTWAAGLFTVVLRIPSSGIIKTTVNAKSGSVEDIQAAIDEAIAVGAVNVIIPEGNFTFAPIGGIGVEFTVPAMGLNIFGAGINRTVLQMPINNYAPDTIMFYVHGLFGGRVRFSGLTFKGRPNIETSPTGDYALYLESCRDFRVDHCSFYYMGGIGVAVCDAENTYGHNGGPTDPVYISQGVIDHCYFYDMYKPQATAQGRGYGYGVAVSRAYHYKWTVPNLYPSDPWTMFGKYDRNVYIEDCYFLRCRHAIQANWAGAYVLRNSLIEDIATYEVATTGHPVRTETLGMLTCEIYNVTIRKTAQGTHFVGPLVEGGSALIYNCRFENLDNAVELGSCEDKSNPFYPLGNTKEVYIWSNTLINCGAYVKTHSNEPEGDPAPVENISYFMYAPSYNGHGYTPYPYPHPLTLG